MTYTYPALFTPAEEGGYLVRFPDIEGCYTDGDTFTEARENGEDVLALMMCTWEEMGKSIPVPSSPGEIPVPEGGRITMITADTEAYRKAGHFQPASSHL